MKNSRHSAIFKTIVDMWFQELNNRFNVINSWLLVIWSVYKQLEIYIFDMRKSVKFAYLKGICDLSKQLI